MISRKSQVLVAMSGGVDSAVTAALLKKEGHELKGVFMCLGNAGDPDSDTSGCCSPQDAADARQVSNKIGIELYVLNLADEFGSIIDYFLDEYKNGRTPNPCVHCNSSIKFGKLLKYADSLGYEYVATGHYARNIVVNGEARIARKSPRPKDQSYVLFSISREILPRVLFPLGEMQSKTDVRDIAKELDLKVHNKPDSQEICFVPDNDFAGYLKRRCPAAARPGRIVYQDGKVIGDHDGYGQYTVGQRKGLGIAWPEPLFVSKIDPARAEVTVGPRQSVMKTTLRADRANWHTDLPETFEAIVQVRYNHEGVAAVVHRTSETEFSVKFKEPVFAITPGQAAVCYDGDVLLGGGWILGE